MHNAAPKRPSSRFGQPGNKNQRTFAMARYPGLMLWTDAWIADTHHLTVELRGAYMDLLILMWRTPGCRVPNDDQWIARHLGYTAHQVTNLVRPLIAEFGILVGGGEFVAQKRLQREFAVAHARKEKAAEANRARWNSRKQNRGLAATNCQAKKKTDDGVIHSSLSLSPAPAHSTVQVQGAVTDAPRLLASAPRGALAREAEPPPDPPEIREAVIDRAKTAMIANGFEFKPEPTSNPANQSSSFKELETIAAALNGRMRKAKRSTSEE
jgi:uncharacterized protein YdaU (DUF1376 family)